MNGLTYLAIITKKMYIGYKKFYFAYVIFIANQDGLEKRPCRY